MDLVNRIFSDISWAKKKYIFNSVVFYEALKSLSNQATLCWPMHQIFVINLDISLITLMQIS